MLLNKQLGGSSGTNQVGTPSRSSTIYRAVRRRPAVAVQAGKSEGEDRPNPREVQQQQQYLKHITRSSPVGSEHGKCSI